MGSELEPRPRTADVVRAKRTTVELGERESYRPILERLPEHHYQYLYSANTDEGHELPILWSELACRPESSEGEFALRGQVIFDADFDERGDDWKQTVSTALRSIITQQSRLTEKDLFQSREDRGAFFVRVSPNFYVHIATHPTTEDNMAIDLSSLSPQEFSARMHTELPGNIFADDDRYELLRQFTQLWACAQDVVIQEYGDDEAALQTRRIHLEAPPYELFMPRSELVKNDVVLFHDIAGYDDIKQQLLDLALLYEHADLAENIGLDSTYGLLLHGPPGTGKTTLLRAFANEIGAPAYELHVSEIIEKWVGGSARNLDQFFHSLKRRTTKTVLIMDEFDAIGASEEYSSSSERTDVVNRLKEHVVDIAHNYPHILMAGATNNLHRIDKNLIRPGRFQPIEVLPPNEQGRRAIISLMLGKTAALAVIREAERPGLPVLDIADDIKVNELARESPGLVGAHFHEILNDIRRERLRHYAQTQQMPPISNDDILKRVRKAVNDL